MNRKDDQLVVIFAHLTDVHASAAKWALARNGVECVILDLYDLVAGGRVSIDESMDVLSWRSSAEVDVTTIRLSSVDCVWLRRMNGHGFNLSRLHVDDQRVAAQDLYRLSTSIFALLGLKAAKSINPTHSRFTSETKTVQLALAQEAGLSVPDTLITNSPEKVKEFLKKHIKIIYKPFEESGWTVNGVQMVHHAGLFDATLVNNQAAIELSPGIYQEYKEKAFELRVTVFADKILAAKLDSQSVASARVDWKDDHVGMVPVSPFDLPIDMQDKIHCFMKKMGLSFGCIDMIVGPDGRYSFLEVNPQGQFLWLEGRCADIPMLHTLTEFLSGDAVNDYPSEAIKLADYYDSCEYNVELIGTTTSRTKQVVL